MPILHLQLANAYLKHRFAARTRHGVHSPFVYRLIDEVIYDFSSKPAFSDIEALRKRLLTDDRVITITDLGAGSHVNNNKQKQVRQLARHALKPARIAQLLYRIVNDHKPRNIIELGTCLGLTTAYLSAAAPQASVKTVEGCPQTAAVAKENLERLGVKNVEIQVGNFDDILPRILTETGSLDFIFIDGNHRKEATVNYFNICLPHIHEQSLMIFDDIYWSKGMQEAWEHIKNHPQVSVTIDLFWIGLVFFKTGQSKEHFKIRF